MKIEIMQGDILQEEGDSVINTANPWLRYGNGLCGQIFRLAGHGLDIACEDIWHEVLKGKPLAAGKCVVTPGFRLKVRHIIHTIGADCRMSAEERRMMWGERTKEQVLYEAHRSAFLAAASLGGTLLCPAISAGIYQYPADGAADIAFQVAEDLCQAPLHIKFGLYDNPTWEAYRKVYVEKFGTEGPIELGG